MEGGGGTDGERSRASPPTGQKRTKGAERERRKGWREELGSAAYRCRGLAGGGLPDRAASTTDSSHRWSRCVARSRR